MRPRRLGTARVGSSCTGAQVNARIFTLEVGGDGSLVDLVGYIRCSALRAADERIHSLLLNQILWIHTIREHACVCGSACA
jgi:hypothetical protein